MDQAARIVAGLACLASLGFAGATAAPAAPWPPTGDRVWIRGGTLNGQALGVNAPAIAVQAGRPIKGHVVIEVTNSHDAKTTFPIYVTPTWGWPSQSYTSQEPGTQQHTRTIDCVASVTPGTYYILFAATNQANGVALGSLTRDRDEVRWDDPNLTDLTGFQIAHAQQHGWTEVLEYGPQGYQVAAYGLAVITVRVSPSPPEAGLVAHWAFDEPAKSNTAVLDSSGHGRHATLAAPASYQTLDSRHTLWFDRRQCLTAPDGAAFSLDRFTIEAVFWLGGDAKEQPECIAAKCDAMQNANYFLAVGPGNRLRLSFRSAGRADEVQVATDDEAVTARRWYKVVAAFDGSRLYLRSTDLGTGRERSWSADAPDPPGKNDAPLTVGGWRAKDDPRQIRDGFNGWIDYVKVYDRARSPGKKECQE